MNKIIVENNNVILTDGTKINISDVIQYYITENHSKKETAEYFNISYQQLTGVIIKGNIIKDNKLSRKLNNKTLLERYGDEHYNNLEKQKQTCIQKYGVDNIFKDVHRIQQATMVKYGVNNPNKLKHVRNKIKKTNLDRYGTSCGYNVIDTETNIPKRELTCKEKYGGPSPMSSEEVRSKYNFELLTEKAFQTKIKNGTTNTSKPEIFLLTQLKNIFGEDEILTQYNKDIRYPYHCDAYVKSIDMFIELNLFFTHGKHIFDSSNINDIEMLKIWKEKAKKSKFYQNAIKVWTVLDPEKLNTALKNNLNYIMIYSEKDLYDFINNLKEIYKYDN